MPLNALNLISHNPLRKIRCHIKYIYILQTSFSKFNVKVRTRRMPKKNTLCATKVANTIKKKRIVSSADIPDVPLQTFKGNNIKKAPVKSVQF